MTSPDDASLPDGAVEATEPVSEPLPSTSGTPPGVPPIPGYPAFDSDGGEVDPDLWTPPTEGDQR